MANKKKIATLSISSILLVAMVVALTIGTREDDKTDGSDRQDLSSSSKAIQTICQSTDYQETCVDTLKSSDKDTDDPKELIELAFEAAVKYIEEAAKNSTVLQKLQSNPRAKSALIAAAS
ncbi:Putative pectinesterase/pectinesterase inhibitor 28 [Olea europaea subsp. europaea]|uniref:Pectinesterase/pectinesterase inhibitor 28 n=1 Tax=Olea europaea subsp. europaea TaxID=158383 RepID=A0A8S0TRI0_OLEEU|nr:Putative pectinesterase/pectinesterase inhibitor 28 [Olea europaea subsp. europaea]